MMSKPPGEEPEGRAFCQQEVLTICLGLGVLSRDVACGGVSARVGRAKILGAIASGRCASAASSCGKKAEKSMCGNKVYIERS
jgi:hypothetical protein